jgi:preprotein translocase subunit SecE
MFSMLKEFITLTKEVYYTDRKEFWESLFGILLIVVVFLAVFYIAIPVFTEGPSYLD